MARRNPNLDLVRAVAILMVLVFHLPEDLNSHCYPLRYHGFLGVNLFFVLSGLLIGRIFFDEQTRPGFRPLPFWTRRWLRTIPPYIALVLIWAGAHIARGESGWIPWSYACFLQNYLSDPYLGEMPFTWSLCVEEHFYVALPLLGSLFARRRLGLVVVALAALPTIARWVGGVPSKATHLHFDGLLCGVLLAHAEHWNPAAYVRVMKPSVLHWAMAAGLLTAACYTPLWLEHGLANLSFTIVTGAATCAPPWRVAGSTLVRSIATTSYSAYLIHGYAYLASDLISKGWWPPFRATAFLGITVLATSVFYLLFEKPSFRLRELVSPKEPRRS